MSNVRPVVAASVVVMCLAACATQQDAAGWVGTITTEGDVTIVVNESGSVWGGVTTLMEEASIGVDVGDEPYMLGSISAVVASEERIYLLEQSPLSVRVYDMAGTHLFDIGREGQGPGELTQTFNMSLRPDGNLLVRVDGNARMNVFSPDGELLDEWPLPGGYITTVPMVMMRDGSVYTRLPIESRDPARGRQRRMVRFSPEGERVGEPLALPDYAASLVLGEVAGTSSSTGRRLTRTFTVPFSPATTSALAPFGAVITGTSDQYRFEVRRFDDTVLIVERNTAPIAVRPEEADWHRKYVFAQARDLDAAWSWSGPDIPSTKPYFSSFFVDESDRIWVRRPGDGIHLQDCDEDPEPGIPGAIQRCWEDAEIIDVFSVDGRYLGEVEMPEGVSLRAGRAFVRDDMIVVPVEDEAGTIMVKRYRLVLPGQE